MTGPRVLLVLIACAAGAARAQEPPRSPVESPTVQLSSSFFRASGEVPADHNALAVVLNGQSPPENWGLSYGIAFGWVRLAEPGDGGALVASHVSNAVLSVDYRVPAAPGLDADLGVAVVMGLTGSDPSPKRRLVRTALGHGIAMQGVYDAGLWAPGRAGFVLPLRLHDMHRLGRWTGSARLDSAVLLTIPSSEEGENDVGRVVQVGTEYAVLPRPWLAAGARLHFVWMPLARLWKTQWSTVPFVAVVRGRWRVSADLLMNLDEPYGFAGHGQRIWAASLRVGAWL